MRLPVIIIKNLITYTIVIFVIYILLMNVTLNLDSILDVLTKSVILALLLVPLTLTGYFNSYIARNASYGKEIEYKQSAGEAFKTARTVLKSMINMHITESDSEKGYICLESDFSTIKLHFSSVSENVTRMFIVSVPKVYKKIQDFDKYIKDVNNLITTISLHVEPDKYEKTDFAELITDKDYIEIFKSRSLIYYRLVKTWLIYSLTGMMFFVLYIFTIDLMPNASTFVFFAYLFLFLLYMFTLEITSTAEYYTCPACHSKLLKNYYNIKEYRLPVNCNHCQKALQACQEVR